MNGETNQKLSPFGTSLRLADGDLEFDGGDFRLVSGRENLMQGLLTMLETPAGTDIFNVNYGFDLLGSLNPPPPVRAALAQPHGVRLEKEYIRLNIVKTLSADDRVREVKEVVFNDEPRYFEMLSGGDSKRRAALEEAERLERRKRMWVALVVLATIPEGEATVRVEGRGI